MSKSSFEELIQRAPERCLLCNSQAAYKVVFFPGKQHLAHGRLCLYGLCEDCYERKNKYELVEQVISYKIVSLN